MFRGFASCFWWFDADQFHLVHLITNDTWEYQDLSSTRSSHLFCCVFTCFLWSELYLPSAQFRFIYTFFLGHEQAWRNRPVEESLAQSYSPAAPGVREEAQCSPGHRKQRAFPINTAPAVAREHSILPPLTHHVPPSPPSLALPSIPLSRGFWPYYWCFDLFLEQAPPVVDKGTLQVSDQLNRTSDKGSDGQDSRG